MHKHLRFIPYFFISIGILHINCANQLPPGGGDEDKEPPKIVNSYPVLGTTNFKGNKILITLNEYVDRRSFQDAFRISPPVEGEINFDWSGKEVEIIFSQPLQKLYPGKTFLINLNSNLRDLHGNALTGPLTFAFSTGNQIDRGEISGKVFDNDGKIITLLCYNISAGLDRYDPTSKLAAYITETSSDGLYTLPNLSAGKYRVIAVQDDDKNLFYTADRENYSVLSADLILSDSMKVRDIDFKLLHLEKPAQSEYMAAFFKDSLGTVYSSVEPNSHTVLPEQSIQFYFNYIPVRSELESSFKILDAQSYLLKPVFNWKSDTLLEVFPVSNFLYASDYTISFILNPGGKIYNYEIHFKTVSSNSLGNIIGAIRNASGSAVLIKLQSKESKPPVIYTFQIQDTVFHLKKIIENDYILFAFTDDNSNSIHDYGKPYPFEFSEKFYYYPNVIKVKAGWSVENVIIDFSK